MIFLYYFYINNIIYNNIYGVLCNACNIFCLHVLRYNIVFIFTGHDRYWHATLLHKGQIGGSILRASSIWMWQPTKDTCKGRETTFTHTHPHMQYTDTWTDVESWVNVPNKRLYGGREIFRAIFWVCLLEHKSGGFRKVIGKPSCQKKVRDIFLGKADKWHTIFCSVSSIDNVHVGFDGLSVGDKMDIW